LSALEALHDRLAKAGGPTPGEAPVLEDFAGGDGKKLTKK